MQLLAISDLHLSQSSNKDAILKMNDHGDDWLIIGGDISEKPELHEFLFRELNKRFGKIIWVPGNHDLWTADARDRQVERGVDKYNLLVELARSFGVTTPEELVNWLDNSITDYYQVHDTNIAAVALQQGEEHAAAPRLEARMVGLDAVQRAQMLALYANPLLRQQELKKED